MIKADFELYAPIKGFEGLYEVSTWGNVRSLDRWVIYKNGAKHFYKGKIFNKVKNIDGYLVVIIQGKNFRVNRLVAETFIPNPNNYPIVNHKDEVRTNNYRCNLEWCTQKYNVNYGNSISKRSKKVYQYDKNMFLIKVWDSTMECLRNGYLHVSDCCNGKRKTCKGYIWSYEELS